LLPLSSSRLINGDALTELQNQVESESVDCCITSPPYWALRDYKTEGQIGLEPTFSEYIDKLIAIFSEVKRVLKKTGSCWVVMGDTYGRGDRMSNCKQTIEHNENRHLGINNKTGYSKSLLMIPSRFAIAMIDNNWILRNDIIWHKPNCMPSSAKDRFTIDYEHLFFFTKSQRYYFETQYEPLQEDSKIRYTYGYNVLPRAYTTDGVMPISGGKRCMLGNSPTSLGRIKRSVWKIPTQPYTEAHFAVYPEKLIETPIKACCPIDNGLVLDPFAGSGTTGLVALKNARNFIGIELNADYIKLAEKRLDRYLYASKLI
jgi:DNA modification methylase